MPLKTEIAHRCKNKGAPSYLVAPDGRSITFRPCGVKSWHKEDVRRVYCAMCGRFILDWMQSETE